jgi:acetyl esterase/lipase
VRDQTSSSKVAASADGKVHTQRAADRIPPTPSATLSPAPSPSAPVAPVVFNPAQLGMVARNVTYCTVDGVPLLMDVYFPRTKNGPWPAVIYIHGGGWRKGDKEIGAGNTDLPALVSAGFLIISVDYRLAPDYLWPAMIEDVKCAVRSLRAHAAEYNVNPNKIGIYGGSAGGHLAALVGTSDAGAGWDVGEYLDQSSRVQAVGDFFGPTDLVVESAKPSAQQIYTEVFGPDWRTSTILAEASPVTYVSPDDPPFLIMHGAKDTGVPPTQSKILYSKLVATGVPATLVMVQNAGHGFRPVGGPIDPSRSQITQMLVDFFTKYLK